MRKILFLLIMMAGVCSLYAQDNTAAVETPKTLFPYPQAPDTIKSFQDRTNYVVIRFWDRFDFSRPIQDEVAFEGAFQDFVEFFPYAHRTVVVNAIRNMMNKAQSNKTNFLLVGRLAEKNLYADNAMFPSDEAYLPFAEAMVKAKQLKKPERQHYANQIAKINRNTVGASCPDLEVTDVDGKKMHLNEVLGDSLTVLFFNDGKCVDCVLGRLRLSTNVGVNELIDEGALKVIYISTEKYSQEWATEARTFSDKWLIVASEKATEVFDLRISPSVYVIDAKKLIYDKNVDVNMLLR